MTASLAAVGCAAGPGELKIRPIGDSAAKLRPGADRLSDARAQLALGNVGLALEGFRKALRDQPNSAEAYAGIAACYEAMGRYDVARTNYEAALALDPNNPVLLNTFAALLSRQGLRGEAAAVRLEVAQLMAASAALDQPDVDAEATNTASAVVAPAAPASAPSVTVALPPPRPAEARPPAVVARPATVSTPSVTITLPAPRPVEAGPPAIVARPAPALAPSVTVALPPARAAGTSAPAAPRAITLPPAEVDLSSAPSPRLERISPGEIALITIERPIWQARVVRQTARSTSVRWVPLASASRRPNIRLLNAARRQGLAAQTRQYLHGRGWRKIAIGDAPQMLDRTVVLYPKSRESTARSLAAQFRSRAAMVAQGDELVVLLGRDVAGMKITFRRG